MATSKLDPIDRHILAELQADGRMTNVELASRVGISAPPCLRRVRTLEEEGYIKGYHADIDARELGFEVKVFAMVRLAMHLACQGCGTRRALAPSRCGGGLLPQHHACRDPRRAATWARSTNSPHGPSGTLPRGL